ncbi:hypothetical protein ACPCXE_06470 [Bacillus velezensis]|uniref:hypothetical protein n=1 Tax=Bacillus TaxID=1386 RepID=UPI00026BA4FA|nr:MULTISPECIES: hypothetical protein [Bacillus]AIW31519.1 hypothetical protein KO64_17255 [Bacillus subtilis]ANB85300.1 hypothetical protein A6R78_15390 [Bacillus velezensis]EJD69244.1 hypothetical protein BB65665_01974 [Bacillus sp. 916]KOC27372.1 hypothetical protein AC810_01790 [Bacillus velezensis]KOC28682.1 hypothetical protein AC811_05130 [Bacillus velezensis]
MRKIKKMPEVSLQSLRIPKGWTINQNSFREIDPKNLDPDDEKWLFFSQDLLQLTYSRKNYLLDLGWYPDADANGFYQLVLIQNEDWDQPVCEFQSNSHIEIVENIESLLNKVTNNEM